MSRLLLLSVLLVQLVCVASAGQVRFDNQKVFRCSTTLSQQHLAALEADQALDLWAVRKGHFDVRVVDFKTLAPDSADILDQANCDVWIDDLQKSVDASLETPSDYTFQTLFGSEAYTVDPFFSAFQTYEKHVEQLNAYASRFPTLAQVIPSIGKTIENRDLVVIRVTGNKASKAAKRTIWFQGGQHAREWASPAATAYIVDSLLNGYGQDAEVTAFLDNFVFYVLTVMNPDGYSYSFTNERLWRKNRRRNSSSSYGVDLNRNWDDHWGQGGSSSSPTAEDYKGTAAASEPEVSAVQNYVLSLPNRLMGIDFHAYGELILRNFGYTSKPGPDEARLKKIGDGMRDAVYAQSGRLYSSEKAAELYITTGSTDDWLTDAAGMEGWTIELGTTFTEPVTKLLPISQQAWTAVKYYLNEILSRKN